MQWGWWKIWSRSLLRSDWGNRSCSACQKMRSMGDLLTLQLPERRLRLGSVSCPKLQIRGPKLHHGRFRLDIRKNFLLDLMMLHVFSNSNSSMILNYLSIELLREPAATAANPLSYLQQGNFAAPSSYCSQSHRLLCMGLSQSQYS